MELLNITNVWVLTQEAKAVLDDIDLGNGELDAETLSIMSNRHYTPSGYTVSLSVHLTSKGFDLFYKHVLARAAQIGLDDVSNALTEGPMETMPKMLRKSYHVIPELEFFTLVDAPKTEES